MTFKRFFFLTIFIAAAMMSIVIAFNICIDPYGLFGNAKGKSLKVLVNNSRVSKYLFSFNYIPSNFDGILLGPSYSINLNTKDFSSYRIYNASLTGSNIFDMKPIVNNVIQKGNVKLIIICLYPQLTSGNGPRTNEMESYQYWATLGSRQMLKYYLAEIYPRFIKNKIIDNDYGWQKYEDLLKGVNVKEEIMKAALRKKEKPIHIDQTAYNELHKLLIRARQHDIKIVGYYHPFPFEHFVINERNFRIFQGQINKLFTKNDIIVDFTTTEEGINFSKNYNNYSDGSAHLSSGGADYIRRRLEFFLDQNIQKTGREIVRHDG